MKFNMKSALFIAASLVAMIGLSRCKKMDYASATTTDKNLVSFMESEPETYSEFVKILAKANTKSYLNAYGAYTLFAPTNTAVQSYLAEINKKSVDELSEDESKVLVRYHLLADTLKTIDFTDGKM